MALLQCAQPACEQPADPACMSTRQTKPATLQRSACVAGLLLRPGLGIDLSPRLPPLWYCFRQHSEHGRLFEQALLIDFWWCAKQSMCTQLPSPCCCRLCLPPVLPWSAQVLLEKPLEEAVVCTVLSVPRIPFQLLGHPMIRHALPVSADRCSGPVSPREPRPGHHSRCDLERRHWLAHTGWVQA